MPDAEIVFVQRAGGGLDVACARCGDVLIEAKGHTRDTPSGHAMTRHREGLVLPKISDLLHADAACVTCAGSGWVCENHHLRPWGGHCCDFHHDNSGVCEHGACGCGAGDPCPTCNQNPTLFSGFAEVIASVED